MITKDSFRLNLQILADTDYKVVLLRNRDMVSVLKKNVNLKKSETESISYQVSASVFTASVRNTKANRVYTFTMPDWQIVGFNTFALAEWNFIFLKAGIDFSIVNPVKAIKAPPATAFEISLTGGYRL